jgi:phage baseplate assembly protein W
MAIDLGTVYSDLGFRPKLTQNGDVNTVRNLNSVKQAIVSIIETRKGTRLFNEDFGMNLDGYLFEHADKQTKSDLRDEITSAIDRFEPRVTVLEVTLKDLTWVVGYSAEIIYQLNEINATDTVVVNLQRL